MFAVSRHNLSLLAVIVLSSPLAASAQAPDPLSISGQTPDQEWAASLSKYFPLRAAQAQSPDEIGPQPQIVRLSLVQGDVRILRGKAIEKRTGDTWEQAVTNLPLAAGYTLATGDGRAEIEFEDASTAYLAPNSVLALNVLTSAYGISQTQLSLLSGTLTTNFHPSTPGDIYILETPSDNLTATYPTPLTARVESYLDSMAVTKFNLPAPQSRVSPSARTPETVVYRRGVPVYDVDLPDAVALASWDLWVKERITTRNLRIARVMKASGLRQPLPGLEELDGKGDFFPCETVGRCWQPNTAWNGQPMPAGTDPSPPTPGATTAPRLTPAAYNPRQKPSLLAAAQSLSNGALGPNQYYVDDDPFPCTSLRTRSLYETDPATGKPRLLHRYVVDDPFNSYPYNWAVCHAGFWVHEHRRYVWYVDRRRHHQLPIRWVKHGDRTGFVPMHPLDEHGKPPLNLRHDVFVPRPGDPHTVDLVEFTTDGLKLLDKTPKEFAHPEIVALQRASTPQPIAREIALHSDPAHPTSTLAIHTTALSFNDKKQAFQLSHQTLDGSHLNISPQHFNASISSLQSQPHNTSEGGRIGSGTWNSAGGSSYSGGAPVARSAPATYSGSSSNSASNPSSAPASSSPAPSSSSSSSTSSSARH